MHYKDFKITTAQAEYILLECFNRKGSAVPLPGELDFNFRISIENGEKYILKISRPGENECYLDFQQKLLQFIQSKAQNLTTPKPVKDKNGNVISEIKDASGNIRKVRLLTWIPGRLWSNVNPHSDTLRFSLGKSCGTLTKALQEFDHTEAHRELVWDIARSLWTKNHIHLFNAEEKNIITHFQRKFEAVQNKYAKLRKSVVHNDANDNNSIVSTSLTNPEVITVIDYGDSVYTQTINDLAVACAYAIMHHNDPLEAALPVVSGYHKAFPLLEAEIAHLHILIAMRLVASVTKSAINKNKEPGNTYLQISERPAWELLRKWYGIHADFAHYRFREACGFSPHPNEAAFKNWATQHHFRVKELFPTVDSDEALHLDLSVSGTWVGHQQDFKRSRSFSV